MRRPRRSHGLEVLACLRLSIAQQHILATCVTILVSAVAVFGTVIAALLFGETLDISQGIGSLCLILGMVIAATISAQLPKPRSGLVSATM